MPSAISIFVFPLLPYMTTPRAFGTVALLALHNFFTVDFSSSPLNQAQEPDSASLRPATKTHAC